MERKVLVAVVIAICVMIGLVVLQGLMFGGIGRQVLAAHAREGASLREAEKTLVSSTQAFEALLSQHKALLERAAINGDWENRFRQANQLIKDARQAFEGANPLLEANEKDSTLELQVILSDTERLRSQAVESVAAIKRRADKLVSFFEKRDSYLANAKEATAKLSSISFEDVEIAVNKASQDWPEKQSDLGSRLAKLKQQKVDYEQGAVEVDVLAAKEIADISPDVLLSKIEYLVAAPAALASAKQNLLQLIPQLYKSYDKILHDMEIREASLVEFFHEYQLIEIEAKNGTQVAGSEVAGEQAKHTTRTEWKKVSKAEYKKHEKHLGMAIESKPLGKYNHEATTIVSPPGYSHVGNQHYGRWDRRSNGSQFWVWYGQYAFMRSMFWGPSYGYINRAGWNNYRNYSDSGRVYYGGSKRNPRFGSNGTYTGSRYKSSKFSKSAGYKNTQFKKSGGRYRGSRFASKKTRSSGSRSSSYSRGSRSFGGSRSYGK